MKERVVIIGILGILLIGILSAAFIPHFGRIVTTIEVIAPEFHVPNHIEDCKNNGWINLTKLDGSSFKNQGDCVSYVATNMCKDHGWENLTREDNSSFKNQGDCVSYFNPPEDKHVDYHEVIQEFHNETEIYNETKHEENQEINESLINETIGMENE